MIYGQAFGERLRREFANRRRTNPRYSLRAFAAWLEIDHSTLSQILRGRRQVPAGHIRRWSKKLEISSEEAAAYLAAQQVPDAATCAQQDEIRQWTAEALSLLADDLHWQILQLAVAPDFRSDCRWVAQQTAVNVDQVNVAFTRLLRLGLITTSDSGDWCDAAGPAARTKAGFVRLTLTRVRQMAAH